MKFRSLTRILFVLLLLASGSGCVTKALWDNGNLEAVKEPAGNVNLRLFAAKRPDDVLVVYDEYSERSDATRTRAYCCIQIRPAWISDARRIYQHSPGAPFVAGADF